MYNGTLISDIEQLVTKFGSVEQVNTSDGVTRSEAQSLSGVTARKATAVTPPEPIQYSPLSGASPSAGELIPTNRGHFTAEDIIDTLSYGMFRRERMTGRKLETLAQAFGDESVIAMERRFQAEERERLYVSPEQLAEEAADMQNDEPELGRDPGETRPL